MIMKISKENDVQMKLYTSSMMTTMPSTTLVTVSDTFNKTFVNTSSKMLSIDNDSIINDSTIIPFHLPNHSIFSPLMHEIMNSIHIIDNNKNSTIPVPNKMMPSENELDVLSLRRTCLVIFFSVLILITIFGNTLVILSLITTRRLRTVTNCFVMSLAIADWTVGVFVMPPAVLYYIHEAWTAGKILCDIWISLDILLCTASILSLCAISLDRYLAVTQPLNYKKRRTKGLAMIMIFVVWIVALLITCPPILGWYEKGAKTSDESKKLNECHYNQNKGYVVFSAMGSFFIPMTVMLYVYSRICCVLTSRHNIMTRTEVSERTNADEIDCDNMTSDYESSHSPKQKSTKRHNPQCIRGSNSQSKSFDRDDSHHTLYELVEMSKSTSTLRSSSMSCKYGNCLGIQHIRLPTQSVHFCNSQTSISDTCSANSKNRIHNNGKRMPIRISSMKRETKAAQTLSMVVGGFIACWLPFFVYYLLKPFLPPESASDTLMSIFTWLGWTNSAINPFIYAFYNIDFRIAFWRLTFRKCCKNKNSLMFIKA